MGTLLFIVLLFVVLAILLGAGGYSVERYWSPAGSHVVETHETGVGGAGGIAAAILALMGLILLFLGFMQWNWFGTRTVAPATTNNPVVATPALQPTTAPSAQTSPSPPATPSPTK